MRWTLILMSVGVLLIAVGIVPLFIRRITFDVLEGSVSLFAIGLLIFLVGWLLRKIAKSMGRSTDATRP